MAIKLTTVEGTEFSFDTVEEFMEFKKKMDEEEASKELTSEPIEDTSDAEIEVPGTEPKLEAGDKVRVVSAEDGTETPYHHINIGSVVEVVSLQLFGRIEVVEDGVHQYLLPGHYEKVEPLGKDANGEDLFAGDFVTGTNADDYYFTNSTVVMEVMGRGISTTDEESCIRVRIVGELSAYRVDSTRFIKLSDKLDEAKTKFEEINGEDVEVVEDEHEFKVGDKVRVVGNNYGHLMDIGEVREIKDVDSEEPKYNLSEVSHGFWAGTSDIERVHSSTKFQSGDVVKVTESFTDIIGDRAICGAVYNYDENLGFGEPFVGTVFLGDNIDKIELVCSAQDRLDKY